MFSTGSAAATRALAAPATPAPSVQQAEAIAKPSVVFIQTQWTGYLVSASFSGYNIAEILSPSGSAPKYKVTTTCSGFIANPNGYIMTAAHCVDDQSMRYGGRGLIVQAAVIDLANKLDLSAASAKTILEYGYSNWTVEGQDKGAPPDRVVGVFPTKAASGITVTTPLQANVINFQPFNKGDVAVLKVETKTPMPALEVAPTAAATGSQVVAMGYPGSVTDIVDPSNDPSMKDGTVSGSRTVSGVPFTEISAATSSGMSGGPVVNLQGQVVGNVSWSPGAETQAFNFITNTNAVRDIMSSNSVDNKLSATDQTYRSGLNDYFAGKYHAAVKKFDQVLQLEPDHALAQEYKRLSITNYPNEKSSGGGSSSMTYILIGAGVLVVALAVAGVFLLRKRRGGGGAPGAVQAGLPAGGGPAMTAQAPPMQPTMMQGSTMPTPEVRAAPMPPTPTPTMQTMQSPEMPPAPAWPPPVSTPAPAPPMAPPPMAPPPVAEPAAAMPPAPPAPPAPAAPSVPEAAPVGEHTRLYCPYCGEPHEDGAHFCTACGFHFPTTMEHPSGTGAS